MLNRSPEHLQRKGQRKSPADLGRGGLESCCSDAVAEVGLPEDRESEPSLLRFVDEQSKLTLVPDSQESEVVRVPKPLTADFGVLERELNGRVDALAALDAGVQVCAGHHVELVP